MLLIPLLASLAQAGSCCVATTSPVPTRLGPCERVLAGTAVRAEGGLLRWDRQGRLRRSSMTEAGLEGTLALGVGLSRRTQLAATLPARLTWRSVSKTTRHGGGLGDLRVLGRYNLVLESSGFGDRRSVPGVWLSVGARAPTGRDWQASTDVLLADVTGLPRPALTIGVLAERTQHQVPWIASIDLEADRGAVAATGTAGAGRTLGSKWTVLGAVGHTVSWTGTSTQGPAARTFLSARVVTGRRLRWRAWAGLSSDLPVPWMGRETALLTRADLGLALVR